MLDKVRKRFYKQAGFAAAAEGFAIQLDGRGVKTPAGKKLEVPSDRLAQAVAAEWEAQGEEILPHSMPLTQLASTAIDRVGPERPAIRDQLMSFAGTDLLCYRADFPPDLVERQSRDWQPLLDWAAAELGVRLTATAGIIAVAQPEDSLAALGNHLDNMNLWRLTAVQSATAAAGSLILALALAHGRLTGDQTFELSQLDETYQVEKWGDDAEAAERRAVLKRDILAAEKLLGLL